MKRTIPWVLSLLLWAPGCSGDDDPPAVGTTGAVTTGAATEGTGPASSSGADGSSSSSGMEPSGPPQCTKMCLFPSDCCPPGAEGCPSSSFPYDFNCVNDLCVQAECTSDAACGGDLSCLEIDGVGTCVAGCGSDRDCVDADASQCAGVADDGAGFCFDPCTPSTCGNSDCDEQSGQCTCASEAQCIVGFECV